MSHASAGVLDTAALALEYVDELVVGSVRDVHTGIAGRVHGVVDHVAGGTTLTHRAHDGIAGLVYASVGLGLRGASAALRAADRFRPAGEIEDSPRGRFVVAAVNGLIGDQLRERRPEFTFDAGIRRDGRDVELTPEGFAAAFPDAGEAIVVFAHGLCETEEYWKRAARPRREPGEPSPPSYGTRLAQDEGWSPVYLRVNTGLPGSENAVAVAALLERMVECWPAPVSRIALVGHSMGGLLLRLAATVQVEGALWPDLVTDVVTLGTPHLGAPLERVVDKGTRMAARLPEVAAALRILDQRSVGILELRHGLPGDVLNLPRARYHLVAGSLTRSPRHPVALGIGDLLVQPRSAFGKPKHGPEMFPGASTLHVPGADHFDLLNHDDIYAAMRQWLAHASLMQTKELSR